jgi:hypothetical protein
MPDSDTCEWDTSFFERADLSELRATPNNETEGTKSVHFLFLNDLDAVPQKPNHIVIDVSGFSEKNVAAIHQFIKQLRKSKYVSAAPSARSFVSSTDCFIRKCRLSAGKQRASSRRLQRRRQVKSKCLQNVS